MFFPWCLMLRSTVYPLIYLPSCSTPLLRNPGRMIQLWCFFYPHREESCLVLKITMRDHRDITTGFVWFLVCVRYIALDRSFFWTILLHFDAKFWYHVVGVHNFPFRKNYLSLILCPLPRGFWTVFVCHKKQFPRDVPGLTHKEAYDTGKCITAEYKNIKIGPLQVRWGKDGHD